MKNDNYNNPYWDNNKDNNQSEELTLSEEIKDKYSFGTYIAYAIVFVMVLIVFGVTGTYAYYTMKVENKFSTTTTTATANCFKVSVNSSTTNVLGKYNYPVTDDFAINQNKLTPFTINIINSCTSAETSEAINYKLYLTTLPEATSNMPDKAMKIYVKKGTSVVKNTTIIGNLAKITSGNAYDVLKKSVQDKGTTAAKLVNGTYYEILSGSVGAGVTDSYSIFFWIDYKEGGLGNNSTQNKTFEALVSAIIN